MTTSASAAPPAADRDLWIVGARAVAICAVVMTHVCDGVVWDSDWLQVRPSWWWTGDIFTALASGGVGMFTMISGALLLAPGRKPGILRFYRRRLLRIVPPYIAWSAIYLAWQLLVEKHEFGLRHAVGAVARGGAYYHLWFLNMILELYLLTPLFRWAMDHVPRRRLIAVLLAWFAAASVLPAAQHALGGEAWVERVPSDLGYLCYAGYFVLGRVLGEVRLGARGLAVATSAWLGGAGWVVAMNFREIAAQGGTLTDEWSDHNLYPQVVIVAVSAVLILRNLPWQRLLRRSGAGWLVGAVSSASFTIYLAHPLLLELHDYSWSPIRLNGAWIDPLVGIPVTTLFLVATPVTFALFIRRIMPPQLDPIANAIAPLNAASRPPAFARTARDRESTSARSGGAWPAIRS